MNRRRPHLDLVRLAFAAALLVLASMGTMTALWVTDAPDTAAAIEFDAEPEVDPDSEPDDDRDDDALARGDGTFADGGANSAPPGTNGFAHPSTELERLLRPPIA